MDLAGYVINAVLVEGRSVKEVCEAHDISRSWLYELIARSRELGDDGLKPLSKRPRASPPRVAPTIEDEIVALRKELTDVGVDAQGGVVFSLDEALSLEKVNGQDGGVSAVSAAQRERSTLQICER